MDPAEGDTPRAGDMGPEGDIREVGRETGVVATDRVIDIVGRDRATGDMEILVLPCLHRGSPVRERNNSVLTFRKGSASAGINVHMPMTTGQDPLRLHLRGKLYVNSLRKETAGRERNAITRTTKPCYRPPLVRVQVIMKDLNLEGTVRLLLEEMMVMIFPRGGSLP
jgi:hypothetical protein